MFFFSFAQEQFYLLCEMMEGFPPLYKSNKADFSVVKFYKVMLALSGCVPLQTALLISRSRVLTFADINNAAAPWHKRKRSEWPGL